MRKKMKMARNANHAATPHNRTISNPTHIHTHLHNLRDSQPHTPNSQSITYGHSQSCTPHGSAHSHTYNHKTSHHSASPTIPPTPTHSHPHRPHSQAHPQPATPTPLTPHASYTVDPAPLGKLTGNLSFAQNISLKA